MLDPQRGQNVRTAAGLEERAVGGSVVHLICDVWKWANVWYGAPDSLRHSVQWQLTSL